MFHGKFHYKWPFSIAMLVYRRVTTQAYGNHQPTYVGFVDFLAERFFRAAPGTISHGSTDLKRRFPSRILQSLDGLFHGKSMKITKKNDDLGVSQLMEMQHIIILEPGS